MAAPGYQIDPSKYPAHTDPAKLWPQDMPMLSESDLSRCRGTFQLLELRRQINAQLSTVAGLYSELLGNSLQSIGTESTDLVASIFASFAKAQKELKDLSILVAPAAKTLDDYYQMMRENTSSSGETR